VGVGNLLPALAFTEGQVHGAGRRASGNVPVYERHATE
jgi:hypothetical protein